MRRPRKMTVDSNTMKEGPITPFILQVRVKWNTVGLYLRRYGGMTRVHKQHNFKPEGPPTPNPMRWQYLPGRTFGQEVCAQCD